MYQLKTTLLWSFMLLASSCILCIADNIPSSKVVNQWAHRLGTELKNDFMSATEYDELQDSYSGSIQSSVRFNTVRARDELDAMASKITDIFTRRTQALKNIVGRAEELTLTYKYDPKLRLSEDGNIVNEAGDRLSIFKMADFNASSAELARSDQLGREVNGSQSGVHTPLEVYEGWFFAKYKRQLIFMDDVDVLNGLRVTAGVDEAFRANRARDPDLSWQYLGTQLGFLRVYPATWWQPPAVLGVDLYDARRRPWYIEGSVSPKDVVILMDISGSVHGQTFEIMKIAVKTVLNTLGENDYVNIAWSTNLVGWVNPCINRLVPATMINKRALAAAVDAMEARNTSDWSKGLEFAYQAFVDFYTNEPDHAGAQCHKLIMFFSDGGTEWPGDVIDKYKNETITKDVRLFSYALGPHPVPSHVMRKMACDNGGSFSVIVASGAIRTSIQESYLSVLGKSVPLALSDSHYLAESPPYLDALGLGYVTTLSMPVFNRSQGADSGPSLMGVAGVDISMREILRHAPGKKLGLFGYTFAVNPNGIVVFHPRLREPLHYMEDPPDLDLTQVEGDTYAVIELRQQMIRRNSDTIQMSQRVTLPDGHQVELRDVTFTFRPVANTTLSLGLALPAGHTHMVVSGQPVAAGLPDCDACLLAPSWEFCTGISGNATEKWRQLSDRLKAGAENCSSELVQHLLWDVGWTSAAPQLWRRRRRDGVLVRFIVTDGGLTRFQPADSGDDLATESEPYSSSLYRQAALTDDLIVRPRPDTRRLLAAKRIAVANSTGGIYTLAVAGVQYSSDWLWQLADRVMVTADSAQPACSPEAGLHCWLLDTAGHVVYASGELPSLKNGTADAGGPHLGLQDPELMARLVNASVYDLTTVYEYQGVCKKSAPKTSAGSLLRDPLSWLNAQLLLDSVSGLLRWLDYLRYLLVSWVLSAQTAPVSALDEFGFEIQADEHACTQRLVRTRLVAALQPYQGETQCADGSCTRVFRASLVDDTNLLLVVANPPCGCPELAGDELAYKPTEDVGPDWCDDQANRTALFRRRPDTCYASREDEKPACSGAISSAAPPALLLLLPVLLLSASWTSAGPSAAAVTIS